MKRFFLFSTLVLLLTSAHAQVVQKRTLPNGLTVLVQENRAAPVAAVRIYVKTGSIYENRFLGAGLSHLFEHTLFEGTKTRDKKALNDELQAIGGQSNAYTSYDVTAYHITTAAPYFSRALGVLADMMQNATFPEAEIKVQQGVIHNEMNIGADDPDRSLGELFDRTAFRVHPARYPIIGFREQFDRISRDDILSYYKSHYTPGNSVLSVAGDVSAPEVFAAAEREFGAWERATPQALALPAEPRQSSPRRAVVEKDVALTYLQMGWHTIPLQHPDLYALDTLSQILAGDGLSRLVKQIRETGLASSITSYSSTPNYDAGVFAIRAILPPKNITRVERAVVAQIEKIKKSGVTEAELARAKRQIRASFIFSKQGVENQAEQAAYDELGTGDPTYSTRYVNRISGVTAAQIRAVANKYLYRDGLTTAIIKPRAKNAPATPLRAPSGALPGVPRAGAPSGAPRVVKLPNGVTLILRPNNSAPTVSMVAMGLGGVRLENAKQGGISGLAAEMLTRGTKRRSADQISQIVGELGGSLDGFAGYNSWGVAGSFLASDWRRGLNLVAESTLTPTFPQTELAKVKAQTFAAIASQDDDPMSSASILLRKAFYGNHPYSRNPLGTPQSVRAINSPLLQAFWKRVLQPRSMVVSVSGQFNSAQVESVARLLFGSFKGNGSLPKAPAKVVSPPTFTLAQRQKAGLTQSVLWYGFPSVNLKSKDRFALDVLDAALSGADLPGGRLHERLRNNQLVYVTHAYDSPGLDGGMFVVYAATEPKNRAEVRRVIEEEIARVQNEDISPDELERAKTMLISSHAIELQTNAAQARDLASNQLFGLGVGASAQYAAKINQVTVEDVRRVANQYLKLDQAALAVVEPS